MANPIAYFEVHVGFPNGSKARSDAERFLKEIQGSGSEWTRSIVKEVHIGEHDCMDPHNVPGTLESLISRQIHRNGESWDDVIEEQVLPNCNRALERLSRLDSSDARVEIEYPFGCCSIQDKTRVRLFEPAVEIAAEKLTFPNGMALDNVPKWEIHFVLEPRPGASSMTIEEVPTLLSKHSVNIEQTIEYQSQSMTQRGDSGYKFIATSYYDSENATLREAERLFFRTPIVDGVMHAGYDLKLVLEHIVGCFRPLTSIDRAKTNEVSSAI